MNTSLVTIIGAVIIAAIIIFCIYLYTKLGKDKKYIKAANQFLEGIQGKLLATINDIIDNYDFNTKKSLEEIETEILTKIYDNVWDYILETMNKSENKLIQLASKIITKEFVIDHLNKLIEEIGIKNTISSRYAAQNIKSNSEAVIEADKKLQEEFAKEDYIEDADNIELPPAEKEQLTEEEASKLNPPTDEVVYSDDDTSVEVVEKKIILRHDKNNKPLYYEMDEDGALKRVTKKYVDESGLPVVEE